MSGKAAFWQAPWKEQLSVARPSAGNHTIRDSKGGADHWGHSC